MNNIFENAYFGKAYRTKDGRKAVYLSAYKCNSDAEGEHVVHRLVTEHDGIFVVHNDGSYAQNDIYSDWNVVSEWQEPIDEVKLTDKSLAAAIECNLETGNSMTADQEYWYQQGYYDGYSKALEDKQ